MKLFYKFAMVTVLLLSAAIAHAADYDFEADGIYYKILSVEDMTASVVKGDKEYSGKIEIPSYVSYGERKFTVTTIGASAFNRSTITDISLPNTLTLINDYAFANNELLKSIDLPTDNSSLKN